MAQDISAQQVGEWARERSRCVTLRLSRGDNSREMALTRLENARAKADNLSELIALLEKCGVWELLESGNHTGAAEALWLMFYTMP